MKKFLQLLVVAVAVTALVFSPSMADDTRTTDDVKGASGEAVVLDRTPHVGHQGDNPAIILYSNGELSTGSVSKSGVTAPPGSTWSEVQNTTGDTLTSNTTAGFSGGIVGTTRFRLADDFTIPAGETWLIDSITTFAYQTGSTPTSYPFNLLNLRLWIGVPDSAGSVVAAGDTSTNVLGTSYFAAYYRVFNTRYPPPGTAPGTTRPVYRNTMSFGGVAVPEGTYWLDWQTQITTNGAHFAPSVTVVGRRGNAAWNGRQRTTAGWATALDAGNPAAAPDSAQDFPFIIYGTRQGGNVFTKNPNRAIPDNNTTGILDSIFVGFRSVARVHVSIDTLVHTYVGDLNMRLTAPDGDTVLLMNRPGSGTFGSSGDNFYRTVLVDTATLTIEGILPTGTPPSGPPYTGFFRPDQPLAGLNGAQPAGYWVLRVRDLEAADTGTLRQWSLRIDESSTGVGDGNTEVPTRYALEQNYPNPFNPTTTIRYSLPEASTVSLRIYDVLGREVMTLVDDAKSAGQHQVVWHGRNESGVPVSTGLYFYRIEAKSAAGSNVFVSEKKMLMLK